MKTHHGLTRFDRLIHASLNGAAMGDPNHHNPEIFGRIADRNPLVWTHRPKQDLVAIFERLVDEMEDTNDVEGPADAGMTFFGQFVDHDITLDATSAIGSAIDPQRIRNIRTPKLDLDCVYGDGPEASPYLYAALDEHDGYLLFGRYGNPSDLCRNIRGTALIGDHRNDENIFVSQVQSGFIRLHNLVLHEIYSNSALGQEMMRIAKLGTRDGLWSEPERPPMSEFEMARRFVRLHYQYAVINDFLPQFVDAEAIEAARASDLFPGSSVLMPVEFSGAAYRFGHATAQQTYVMKNGDRISVFKKSGFEPRGSHWNIDFTDFFQIDGSSPQKARPVGTTVASDLFRLPFVEGGFTMPDGTQVSAEQAAKLPLRNLLRDRFALELASGQQMATQLGLTPLPVPPILADENIVKTPLWFYCLQEADEAGSQKLTGVGGRIVAEVFMRVLREDEESYVNTVGFTPHPQFDSVGKMLGYVQTSWEDFEDAQLLYGGA